MKNSRSAIRLTFAGLAGAIALLFSGVATAAEVPIPVRLDAIASPPDVYHFFEDDRKKVVDYKTDRTVRVCVTDNRHNVPMKVYHDSRSSTVQPGDCIRVEGKVIELQPERELDADWMMRAEVETMS